MLPALDPDTGFLPVGDHLATWQEIEARFGWNPTRRLILAGFLRIAVNLRDAGCRAIFLNGSFVTSKEFPRDFDACCDHEGIDHALVDPMLKDGIATMRRVFGGEIQPATWQATPDQTFYHYFQQDNRTGKSKGIVKLDLASLPSLPPCDLTVGEPA